MRFHPLRRHDEAPGLTLEPFVLVGTGDPESARGTTSADVGIRAVVDIRPRPALLALRVGATRREDQQLLDRPIESTFDYGFLASFDVVEDAFAMFAEADGAVGLESPKRVSPVEVMAGMSVAFGTFHIRVGAGMGLGDAYGTPEARAFVSAGYVLEAAKLAGDAQ